MRRSIGWVGAMIAAAIFANGLVMPQRARAADPPPIDFQRLVIDTKGDLPEACFRFTEPLDADAEAHYGDYVAVSPGVSPSLRVDDKDLCLGGLSYGINYKVTLRQGLPARSGTRMAADETIDVTLGDRAPLVALSGDGYILPRAKGKGLAIETVNVSSVKIRVLRMGDRALSGALHNDNPYVDGSVLRNDTITPFLLRNYLRSTMSVAWSGTMAVEPDHNRTVTTAFPLTDIIKPNERGAYLIVAEDAAHAISDKYLTAAPDENEPYTPETFRPVPAHWVISTDIALTAVSAADALHIFARSLDTAEPLAGIRLDLLATGQDVLAHGVSDESGHATFAPGLLHGIGANAPALVAAYGPHGDFALIELNRPAFDLSDRGVSGRPAPEPVEAYLYTERGIYRPGQIVEAMALLRDRLGRAIPDMKLALTLRRPDGVEAQRISLDPAPDGGFHAEVPLSATAARGQWTLEARVDPSGAPVGRVQFDVEDFVPQQLKVTVTAETKILHPGDKIAASVDGEFLYGAPAAGLNGEAELRITRDPAPVPNAKDYRFGLVDEKVSDDVQNLDLPNADDKGHAEISETVTLPSTGAPLKGVLSAGFFDPAGRVVKDEIELPIRNQLLLIGIKPRFADDRAQEDQDAGFDIRAFDDDGKPVARSDLRWRLIEEEQVFDWFETGGNGWTWHYHVVDHEEASGTIDVAETGPTTLSHHVEWGSYRLVVEDPTTHAATSVRFRAGWLRTADAADTPDKIDVTVDKESYTPGETARIKVAPPFAGLAQLTIAGDRVFETRAVSVPKDGATFAIKVSSDWGPGAYAVLSLYRPLNSGRPRDPVRAVGVAWLGLDPKPHTLAVKIDAPDKITPRQRITVPLEVDGAKPGDPAYVTLAAVDEGILQLTRFATPDPADFFFGKRRLGIDIRDDYGRLLDASTAIGSIREGGDAPIGGEGLPVVSTRTVALFSGPVKIGVDGKAAITLDVPDFEGQLRLMAVAYDRAGVGHGEAKMFVRDPVIADVALPRFLAPGDTARLAIELHNTDGVAGQYHLALKSSGAAFLLADHALDYDLAAGARKLDRVTIEGSDEGIATIDADLTGPNGYAVHREWQLAVRSPHYPITIEDTALQAKGDGFHFDPAELKAFLPGGVRVSVDYSGFGGIDVASLLQSLDRYPFGCTEQQTSIAFPLLYYNDPTLLGRAPQHEDVRARVQAAIDAILDRQDAGGRFGLWRAGDDEASAWLNVYALDFLVHAKEAGFRVSDGAIERSLAWVANRGRMTYGEDALAYAQSASATRAYASFVLARAGRADLGDLRRTHDALRVVRKDGNIVPASVQWGVGGYAPADAVSLGHIAGALMLMGDRARARDTFDLAIANLDVDEAGGRFPPWWWYDLYATPTRDLAALISVAAEVGDTEIVDKLVTRLRAISVRVDHLNTQEQAWLLIAAHTLNKEGTATLTVNGEARNSLPLPAALAPSLAEAAAGYTVVNSSDRDLWRTVVISGAPKDAPSSVEAGFSLTKTYLSLDGKPIDPTHLKQNDRLIVSLTGHADGDDDHRAVLVDMLPAGWEIETPIANDKDYGFLAPLTRADAEEARDDRFVAAFRLGDDQSQRRFSMREQNDAEPSLDANEFHVAYLVRVVTPGHFTLPEAEIEDMYKPGVMARTSAGETDAEAR